MELNPGRGYKARGKQEVAGWGDHVTVIDVDGNGVLVGIDSITFRIVDVTKLEAEGQIFRRTHTEEPGERLSQQRR